ncbi:hypothetical protein [Massilia sp. AB1]|nr:hypothetical protein [Massilia sp. AB1]
MEKKYWFPAKPPECGCGWGLPLAWQGWAVVVSYDPFRREVHR